MKTENLFHVRNRFVEVWVRPIAVAMWLGGMMLGGIAIGEEIESTIRASLQKKDDRVEVRWIEKEDSKGEGTQSFQPYYRVDIFSNSGIGSVKLTPVEKDWPALWMVRLHTQGLEHLEVSVDSKSVLSGAVDSSTLGTTCTVSLHDADGGNLPKDRLEAIGFKAVSLMPTKEYGGKRAFEFALPRSLIQEPKTLTLRWIDFYR